MQNLINFQNSLLLLTNLNVTSVEKFIKISVNNSNLKNGSVFIKYNFTLCCDDLVLQREIVTFEVNIGKFEVNQTKYETQILKHSFNACTKFEENNIFLGKIMSLFTEAFKEARSVAWERKCPGKLVVSKIIDLNKLSYYKNLN